tara:strand:- start:193 stop:369 length:177 start_codon:yes stop_codon:yes gene_type:complete
MTSNQIIRFRDKGWKTKYTGSYRGVGDDGKLKPSLELHKIQAKKKKGHDVDGKDISWT